MMPGDMNGLELAREIRRRKPCLPIVLTTGYAEAASGMKPKEFELLLKPYTIEALSGALKVKAERERQLDEAALTELSRSMTSVYLQSSHWSSPCSPAVRRLCAPKAKTWSL